EHDAGEPLRVRLRVRREQAVRPLLSKRSPAASVLCERVMSMPSSERAPKQRVPVSVAAPLQPVQTRLKVSEPGDPFEREAERVAEHVLRMETAGTAQPQNSPTGGGSAIAGGGEPLPAPVREFFEPRFGHDFRQVRVHTGDDAARSARGINALAYTTGCHIVFGAGQYHPGSSQGRRLLAHELTHVVQQGGAGRGVIQRSYGTAGPDSNGKLE